MKQGWIDAHTHLNADQFREDFNEVMQRIEDYNIVKVNLIGTNPIDSQWALTLVDRYEVFDCSIGLHPADLKEYSEHDKQLMRQWASDPRVVSIGEIGLDYYWHKDNIEQQKATFIDQIELANEVKKPVMIHCRDAMEDTIDILSKHRPLYGCVMHCFSGTADEALQCVELGFMISLGGPLTFKNGQMARDVAKVVPLDQLLIETDAPYLTPHPFRGKRNESSYVRYVGIMLAQVKEISEEKLQKQLIFNYQRIFQKLEK